MTNKDRIKSLIQYADQYQYIHYQTAEQLLGKVWFDRMMLDPIRSKGPVKSTVYPWNVLDYMNMKDASPHKDGDLPLSKMADKEPSIDKRVQNSNRLLNLAKEITRKWQNDEPFVDDIKNMILVISDIEG